MGLMKGKNLFKMVEYQQVPRNIIPRHLQGFQVAPQQGGQIVREFILDIQPVSHKGVGSQAGFQLFQDQVQRVGVLGLQPKFQGAVLFGIPKFGQDSSLKEGGFAIPGFPE